MKIIPTNEYHSGHADHGSEKIKSHPKHPLSYDKICKLFIEDAPVLSEDQSPKLKIQWEYKIHWNNEVFFEFNSYEKFHLHDIKIDPTDEELEYTIVRSHNNLHQRFDEKRDEFHMFDPIPYLFEDTVKQLASQLRTKLLEIPK